MQLLKLSSMPISDALISMKINPKELKQFEQDAQVQYELDTSHQVPIMAITKSNHNPADPFDLMCLQELEQRANGIEGK